MPVHRLALFDIDCTLIDAHGAGGRAILGAIAETYGVSGSLEGYTFHGRTDPGIVADLATRWGASDDAVRAGLDACLADYMRLLEDEVAAGTIEVLPGVRELVTALAADERVLLGLLTGNIEAGAAVKLAPTGLAGLFAVGAYGSDSPDRPELPAFAVERARALTGHRYEGKEIAIIGDTPCGHPLRRRPRGEGHRGRHRAAQRRRSRGSPPGLRLPRPERLARGLRGDPRLSGRSPTSLIVTLTVRDARPHGGRDGSGGEHRRRPRWEPCDYRYTIGLHPRGRRRGKPGRISDAGR